MGDSKTLSAVKAAGAFLVIGLSLCAVGWLLRSIAGPLAFFLWLFGVPIAVLSIPFGLVAWFGTWRTNSRSEG
ncbi:hypothetical protein [Natronomonas sp.]|uniref:hypothetical protein n=1 Tax=Natronomonas sp. TaxID=2184060 RepID=UPI00263859A5|nr:hypothetical protein [Natronomonas sp.]